jgi:hypothetical protein
MTSIAVKFLDLFRSWFTAAGIDYDQLRSIVSIKLTMDNRRHIVAFSKRKKKEPSNSFLSTFLIYLFMSLFTSLMFFYYSSFTLAALIFFTYIMMMIGMTLITDFSSVLLDTSDNTIILPRPVDSRTLFFSRIIHISTYLGQLAAGLTLIPLLIIIYKYAILFSIVFFISIILAIIFSLISTLAAYLVIMRFTSEEKLKNMINYLQIGMTILLVGGYQLGPRMMARMENQYFEIDHWSLIIPPAWMTGMLEAIQLNSWDNLHLTLTAFSFLIPIGGGYLVLKYLTPSFNRKLSLMDNSNQTEASRGNKKSLLSRITSGVTRSPVERSAFDLVFNILGRDRKIKLKIYPTFGYALVFALVFLITGQRDMIEVVQDLRSSYYFVFLIYLVFMVLQVTIHEISYADDHKASWMFFVAPIDKPGEILSGSIKAIMVRLFIPVYMVICVVVMAIWGVSAIDDLIFGFFNNLLMVLMLIIVNPYRLPFSIAPHVKSQTGSFARSLLTLLLVGSIGLMHYFLSQWPIVIWTCIPLQLVVIYLLLRSYRSISWSQIQF